MPEIRRLTSQQSFVGAENSDLPRLACNAAFELDNFLVGEDAELDELDCLARLLMQQNCESESAVVFDPTTVIAMSMAIDETEPDLRLTSSSEVITETGKMGKLLAQVAANPDSVERTEIEKLRKYCLFLSDRTSASEQFVDEWETKNPWRR